MLVEAEDEAGNRKPASLGFTVDSRLKTGNMNIGFTDLVAKLPFGSLNLQRFYNSNNKTCGDFGYGWTMGLTGMTLRENSDISRGYEQVVSGKGMSTSYHIRQTANHDVTVHYGDGTSDRFRLTLSPNSSGLVPIRLVKVGFTCQTSQGVSLELAGDNSAGLEGSNLLWEDESKFDEIVYILTMKDKTKVCLTADKGVFKIEDSLGNTITVDENGCHGEGNKGITLKEYDETGRLTATIDAEGNRMEYAYDVEGRPQAIQDRCGYTTAHTYDDSGNIRRSLNVRGSGAVGSPQEPEKKKRIAEMCITGYGIPLIPLCLYMTNLYPKQS